MFIVLSNQIVVLHSVEIQKTTCCITEAFLDVDIDWWQLWIWDDWTGRFELYGDARCATQIPTGYSFADESMGLDPEMENDLYTIQAEMKRYRQQGGEKPPTLEELFKTRLADEGWGDGMLRPCPRCAKHWPMKK